MTTLADLPGLRALLRRDARRLTTDPDEAEDLVQECLVIAARRGAELRDPTRARAWCRTVLRNLHRQRLRRRWRSEVGGLETLPEGLTDPWAAIDTALTVGDALSRLPDRIGGATRWFYLGGSSIAEIARDASRPEGTVKRWLHEGREALRVMLAESEGKGPLARIYATDWMEDTLRQVVKAAQEAGYTPVVGTLAEDEALPTDAALFVFGERVGCRSGLELLLALRATEATAKAPVLLFGPARQTAISAAWQGGADAYLTNPSSPDVLQIMRQLRAAAAG